MIQSLIDAAAAMSLWEALAVLLGLLYLVLAMRESLWCWAAAAVSTAIYLVIFWQVGLLMASALQIYYLAMAGYGWYHWHRPSGSDTGALQISRWSARTHLVAISGVLLLSTISGGMLGHYTDARLPFLDSFTTWASILTTWMVTRKILENWLYWVIIDAVSIVLYLDRQLYLTVLLFALYVVIACAGYLTWRAHYRAQAGAGPTD